MEFKSLIDKIIEGGRLLLTQPTMLFRNREDITLIATHEVKRDEEGRIDLIASDYYGDTSKVDYILKFNGISDPFSIVEGDLIKIPVDGVKTFKLDRPSELDNNIVRQEFIESKRLTKKDKKRIDFLKKKYKIKEVLPPNVLKTGFTPSEFKEDGSTVMGMGPQTPETTFKPSGSSKSSGSKIKAASKKAKDAQLASKAEKLKSNVVLKSISGRDPKELTDREIAVLARQGISVADLIELQKGGDAIGIERIFDVDTESDKSYKTEKVGGGKMSTQRAEVYDRNKKTTTTTKTIVRPDGSSETTQTVTFSKSNDESNSINLDT
jgi:hypothetical protein